MLEVKDACFDAFLMATFQEEGGWELLRGRYNDLRG